MTTNKDPFDRMVKMEPNPEFVKNSVTMDRLRAELVRLRRRSMFALMADCVLLSLRLPLKAVGVPMDEMPLSRETNAELVQVEQRITEVASQLDPQYAERVRKARELQKRMKPLLDMLFLGVDEGIGGSKWP